MGFNEQDTVIYRLVIFVLTLTFTIVGIHNISKYNAILNDTDDTHIGLSRGTVIWFKWLNIIMVIVCLGLFIYNLWRIIFVKSVKFAIPDSFFNESKGVVNVEYSVNKSENSVVENKAHIETSIPIQKNNSDLTSALNIASGKSPSTTTVSSPVVSPSISATSSPVTTPPSTTASSPLFTSFPKESYQIPLFPTGNL